MTRKKKPARIFGESTPVDACDGLPRGPLREDPEPEELWLDGREFSHRLTEELIEHYVEYVKDAPPPDLFTWFDFEDDHWTELLARARLIAGERRRRRRAELDSAYMKSLESEESRIDYHNRRDLLGGDLTLTQWKILVDAFDKNCAYCENRAGVVLEHMKPVSRGGRTTLSNVVPSCWICNIQKGVRTVDEWMKGHPYESFLSRKAKAEAYVSARLQESAA